MIPDQYGYSVLTAQDCGDIKNKEGKYKKSGYNTSFLLFYRKAIYIFIVLELFFDFRKILMYKDRRIGL